jgi:hypothetical protein
MYVTIKAENQVPYRELAEVLHKPRSSKPSLMVITYTIFR